jgi:hypothetical protein
VPVLLPLQPSIASYRFSTELAGDEFLIDVRWNSRDESWYLDVLLPDETLIMAGLRVVLGALGIRYSDSRRPRGMLLAYDRSGEAREAGFDDIGERVVVLFFTVDELEALPP